MARSSLQLNLPPTEVHTVDRQRSTAVQPMDRERWAQIPGIALAKAGIQRKAAAADMELDPSLLTAQLSGKKHLSWLRMGMLPPAFWRELILLICDFYDIALAGTEQDRRDLETGRALRNVVERAVGR